MGRRLCNLFPAAEAALYLTFLILDFTQHTAASIPVKYVSILLCLFVALGRAHTVDCGLVAGAMLLTAGADWFLLVLDRYYTCGILLFCGVQTLYFARLSRWRGHVCRPLAVIRLLPLALFFLLESRTDALALFYFVNLACNALEAALLPPGVRQKRFAAGLWLFVCCDLCVGAFNLRLAAGLTRYAMWLFYLPSQVLITLSTQPHEGARP